MLQKLRHFGIKTSRRSMKASNLTLLNGTLQYEAWQQPKAVKSRFEIENLRTAESSTSFHRSKAHVDVMPGNHSKDGK